MRRFAKAVLCSVCILLGAGCTGVPGVECHGSNWYRLGYDDGRANAGGERERYALSCGNDFDAARYQEGFQEGSRRAKE